VIGGKPPPTLDRCWQGENSPAVNLMDIANPLWEMSSFSEASKTAALLADMLTEPPSSGASPLPHWIAVGREKTARL
ncbi:hypothetical protein K7431_30705, partial [Pseudomonas fluorescens group sp.]|uniref:hypothetical protein n=1 Tax=Pseudomonas fluorescens group sp. TaxID=2810293 RepID=UPI001CCB5E52